MFHALALFAEKNIDFSDALITAEMLARGYTEITPTIGTLTECQG